MEQANHKSLSIPGKSQADIVMGCQAPDRLSPDYYALRVGNNILGEFGMMGRLGKSVREDAGLALLCLLLPERGARSWRMGDDRRSQSPRWSTRR